MTHRSKPKIVPHRPKLTQQLLPLDPMDFSGPTQPSIAAYSEPGTPRQPQPSPLTPIPVEYSGPKRPVQPFMPSQTPIPAQYNGSGQLGGPSSQTPPPTVYRGPSRVTQQLMPSPPTPLPTVYSGPRRPAYPQPSPLTPLPIVYNGPTQIAQRVRSPQTSLPTGYRRIQKTPDRLSAKTIKRLKNVFLYLLMMTLALFFLFPTVFMFISSVKANEDQLLNDMTSFRAFVPYGDISLKNYADVFARLPFGTYLFNSFFVVACIVGLGLLINSLIAYALARMNFPGRNLLIAAIVALIIIPFEAIAVPLLLLVNHLPWFDGSGSWIDSYHVQVIPFIADAFSIFLFYQFFINIPKELEEAAHVDGASRFRMYWQIILPLSRPIFATVTILQLLTHIGDFLWPLMVTRGDQYRPLMVGIQVFFGQAPRHWGPIMAYASMVTLPMLLLFLLFQRWFLRSAASIGVKG